MASLNLWETFDSGLLVILVFAMTLCATLSPRAQEAAFSEYQVKAAWLLNFARFVEWPALQEVRAERAEGRSSELRVSSFESANAKPETPNSKPPSAASPGPFVVGILGRDPFGKHLEQAFAGKTVKGRAFEIRRLAGDADPRGCHILFIAPSAGKGWKSKLLSPKSSVPSPESKVHGPRSGTLDSAPRTLDSEPPVLTVGESEEFLEQGGIINFLLKDKSVRFEINLKAAQAAGLSLNANLLKVAVAVRGKYD